MQAGPAAGCRGGRKEGSLRGRRAAFDAAILQLIRINAYSSGLLSHGAKYKAPLQLVVRLALILWRRLSHGSRTGAAPSPRLLSALHQAQADTFPAPVPSAITASATSARDVLLASREAAACLAEVARTSLSSRSCPAVGRPQNLLRCSPRPRSPDVRLPQHISQVRAAMDQRANAPLAPHLAVPSGSAAASPAAAAAGSPAPSLSIIPPRPPRRAGMPKLALPSSRAYSSVLLLLRL